MRKWGFVRGLSRAVVTVISVGLMASSLTLVATVTGPVAEAKAADLSQFQAGSIISDALFFDANAMSVAEIQAFLNSKVPTCAQGYVCLKDFTETTHTVAGNPMCGTYEGAANESAATIIYRVGQLCGISSKAILVMLQKEQGLVLSSSPTSGRFQSAMGAGCPDTAACDADYYGFFNQVRYGSYLLKRYTQPVGTGPGTNWDTRYDLMKPVGQVSAIQYNPNVGCGTQDVFIANQATHSLYLYTPYTPNAAALAAGYSVGDGCSSYGNRNFFQFYTDWFGSTQGSVPASTVEPSVSGTASAGSLLTANTGTWTGLAAVQFQPTGPNATLTYNGYNVMAIQNALASAGIPTTIDGIYGPQTTANVRAYQSRNGLTADGIVGPITWGRMSVSRVAPATFAWAWYSCAAATTLVTTTVPAGCTSISGASAATYPVTAADAGRFIAARITATNGAGSTSKWTASTAAVVGPTITPTITGTPIERGSLAVALGAAASIPGLSFDWYSCASASTAQSGSLAPGCAPISGAHQSTYAPSIDDVGTFLSVAVTAPGSTSAVWSPTTSAVQPAVAPTATPTPTPSVSPTPTVGPSPTPTPTATPTPTPTPTATPAPTATPTPTPTATPAPTATPTPTPAPLDRTKPSVSGTPAVGSTLTASPNSWTGLPVAAFTPSGPNAGRTFNGYNVMSVQNALVSAGIPTAIDGIYGPQTIANVRTFQRTNGLTVDGIVGPQTWGRMAQQAAAAPTFAYAWYSCSTGIAAATATPPTDCAPIAGATTSSYVVDSATAGSLITARVTATNQSGSDLQFTPTTSQITG